MGYWFCFCAWCDDQNVFNSKLKTLDFKKKKKKRLPVLILSTKKKADLMIS